MKLLPGEILQAAIQTLFPSFLPVKAVTTSTDDPASQTKQTHVLRTNPKRVPMPTGSTSTAKTAFVRKKQRENRIGPWLERNDHMASDLIEVSDESDHADSRTSSSSRYKVERIPPVKPRRTLTKQKQTRTSPLTRDGPRLFGDRTKPDTEGVPIPIPGVQANSMKSKSGYRPFDSINNGPFTPSLSRQPPLNNGNIHSGKASVYFKERVSKSKTPSHTKTIHEEEPARKRRRMEDPEGVKMSREQPIVIDDDVEMSERDELAHSSDVDLGGSSAEQRHLFTRSTQPTKKTTSAMTYQIKEYRAVEAMMSTPKSYAAGTRTPLPVLETNEFHDEHLFSKISSDEELFTQKAKQQRLKHNARNSPETETVQKESFGAAASRKSNVQPGPEGVFFSSSSTSAHNEVESPDAIQIAEARPQKYGELSRLPLHKGSNRDVADAIIQNEERTAGPKLDDGRLSKPPKPPKPKDEHRKARESNERNFLLRRLRYGNLLTDYSYRITIRKSDSMLAIYPHGESLLSDGEELDAFLLSRVLKILQGQDGCTKVMLIMTRTQDARDDKMHLEFTSDKEVCDFVILVQTLAGGAPGIFPKPSAWMNRAFDNHQQPLSTQRDRTESSVTRLSATRRQPTVVASSHSADSVVPKGIRSRTKNSGLLQTLESVSPPKVDGNALATGTVITGAEKRAKGTEGSSSPYSESPDSTSRAPIETEELRSKFFHPRATRSSTMNSVALDGLDAEKSKPRLKFSQTGELGTPWKKPLVYPKTGKKRETVDFQDLERLDDDEFLNDNLIGFYLRYLEHYLEREKPEIAKKVYFFNSYFFERLTQTQKGTKGINYVAVEKWTRTVDIFSRDFVVVPVNENLHWYVAIICNLPNLRRKLADDDDEDEEVDSSASPEIIQARKGESSGTGEVLQNLVEEPDGETRLSVAGLSLGDEDEAPPANDDRSFVAGDVKPRSLPKQMKGSGRRKSGRRSLIKIDPNKPVVVTLDSLGLSRTITRTTLKDYIVEEGKAKRSLDLERGALEGVTAKGIPIQKNYSDCGLFLCAYMEKFVMDPYQFVHDILQRDMDDDRDWPMMNSHELRSRLRNVIMELHRHQEGEKGMAQIPDVGRILLRRPSPPSVRRESEQDLQEIQPKTQIPLVDDPDEEAASQVNNELTVAASIATQVASSPELSQRAALKSAEDAINHPSPKKSKSAVRRTPQAAIVISDDSPSSPGPRHMSSRLRSHADINDDFINGPDTLDSNPQALAERLRRGRSPTSVQAQVRSQSVTTDFMGGLESYAREQSPAGMPREWMNGEIPETQSQERVIRDKPQEDDLAQEILTGI